MRSSDPMWFFPGYKITAGVDEGDSKIGGSELDDFLLGPYVLRRNVGPYSYVICRLHFCKMHDFR